MNIQDIALTKKEVMGLEREIQFYAQARHKYNLTDIKKFLRATRQKFKDDEVAELLLGFKVNHKNGNIWVHSLSTGSWYEHKI